MKKCCKDQSVQLKFRDNKNKIHGPFETTCLLKKLASLYQTRKLRKYYDLDTNNRNTFNTKVFTLVIKNKNNFMAKLHVDFLWGIKMLRYNKYYNSIWFVIWYLCSMISQLPYSVYVGTSILSNSHGVVFVLIHILSVVLTLFVYNILTQKYNSYVNTTPVKPKLVSSYHRALSLWVAKYNNMSIKYFLSMVFSIPANNSSCSKKISCIFRCLYYVLIIPIYILYCVALFVYPETFVKWVLPDYYDIQQDISYFILNQISEVVSNNTQLCDAIYHILNIMVASHIHYYINHNDECIVSTQFEVQKANVIVNSHLLCLQSFLKSKTRISDNHSKLQNIDSICNGIHTFNHKNICLKDYEYFQQLCGFNVNEIKTQNCIRKLIAFLLRRCHKYTFPLMLVSIAIILADSMTAVYIDNNMSTKGFTMMLYCFAVPLIIFFIISWIKMIYDYYNDFNKITKNVQFWMNPDLLVYLHQFPFDRHDSFISSIIRMSVISITWYLKDLNQNNIYYQVFTQSNCIFPDGVAQIILDFLCVYQLRCKSIKSVSKTYDVDQLEQEIDEMVEKTEEIVREYKQNNDITNNSHRSVLIDTMFKQPNQHGEESSDSLLS
eukprot:551639_1